MCESTTLFGEENNCSLSNAVYLAFTSNISRSFQFPLQTSANKEYIICTQALKYTHNPINGLLSHKSATAVTHDQYPTYYKQKYINFVPSHHPVSLNQAENYLHPSSHTFKTFSLVFACTSSCNCSGNVLKRCSCWRSYVFVAPSLFLLFWVEKQNHLHFQASECSN